MKIHLYVEDDLSSISVRLNCLFSELTSSYGNPESINYRASLNKTNKRILQLLKDDESTYDVPIFSDVFQILDDIRSSGDEPEIHTRLNPLIVSKWLEKYLPGEHLSG